MKNQVAYLGQKFYDEHLKETLEPEHNGEFVSIEPESGRYFLGKTDGEAIAKGNQAFPDKILYLLRIGFQAVHKFGGFYAHKKR